MNRGVSAVARIISVSGLVGLSAVHTVWALGSPWPAKDPAQLAEAVVGQTVELPAAAPTAVVAIGAAGAGLLASGLLGRGRSQRVVLRALGLGMVARAAAGGGVALTVLGLPPAGETFSRLDRRYYRPCAAVLGLSLWLAASQ